MGRASLGTGALGVSGMMAACGQDQGAAAGKAALQGGELTWFISDYNGAVQQWLENTLIPGFTREYPNAKVTPLYVAWGTASDEKRDTLYAAGTGPDFMQGGNSQVIQFSKRKITLPIDDRIKQWKDWQDFYPSLTGIMRYQDKQYGVPGKIDARNLHFRKDLFARVGKQIPTTWKEMRDAAPGLTRREAGEIVQLGYDPSGYNWQHWFPAVWQNGGEILSADLRKPAFNTQAGVEALQFWADLLNAVARPDEKLPAAPSGLTRISAGLTAAAVTGQGTISGAIANAPDTVPNIVVSAPWKEKKQIINVFNNWFGLGGQSKYPDLAWALIKHFYTPENSLEYAKGSGAMVPRKSLREAGHMADARYQMKTWTEVLEKYSRPSPPVPGNVSATWKPVDDAINDVRAGKRGAKQALDEAARLVQAQLDEGYAGT